LRQNPALIGQRADVLTLIDVNTETLSLYGFDNKINFRDIVQNVPWQEPDSGLLEHIEGFLSGQRRVIIESEGTRMDGSKFPVRTTTEISNYDLEDWSRIYRSDQDITTELEAAEILRTYQGELRTLAGKISLAEESERHRIASNLHDGTVQNLILARMNLSTLKKALRSQRSLSVAGDIDSLLASSLKETRSMIFELSPPVLYELGLEAGIEWLSDKFNQRTGITAIFDSDGRDASLSLELKVVLFQAVRELLVNIAKHAQAQGVKLIWSLREEGWLSLTVEDDGIGFDPLDVGNRSSSEGGYGLFSLRERLGLLGGEILLQSSSTGTSVTLRAPVVSD
jgi:signal transduction histidine kinase